MLSKSARIVLLQVLGIVCMACAAPAQTIDAELYGLGHNHFFLFIVVTTFIISLIWTFFYLLQVKDTIKVSGNFNIYIVVDAEKAINTKHRVASVTAWFVTDLVCLTLSIQTLELMHCPSSTK